MSIDVSDHASDIDLFTDESLDDPFPSHRVLRDRGPATYLSGHDLWYLGRYAEVRAALSDWETFSSAKGTGLNDVINEAWSSTVIMVDPPVHTKLRKLFTDRLGRRQLKPISETIDQRAKQLAEKLVQQGEFDGVRDMAHDLPANVIMDLVGWPESERSNLMEYASGSFDCVGPENQRMTDGMPKLAESIEYVTDIYDSGRLTPGSFGYTIAEAAAIGEITKDDAIGLLLSYAVAAFDTTINAMSSGMWLFAQNPEQWQIFRRDPALAAAAFNETVRLECPLQFFSRMTTRDVDMGDGVMIPAGARVLISFGGANRDGRHYEDPDEFRIERNPVDHLAFGSGVHACVGQNLARMEGIAVFRAMASRAKTVELNGPVVRALNNMTRGLESLPLRVS
ncbi:cytochrome P450 [Tsukamurella soli]|uniref:Cytochrome P450 n=1 Tax=Tsukamurella soli TaxID=644556 RepID=A0ABP8K8W5_9ACTN